jgi:hypothetical protein
MIRQSLILPALPMPDIATAPSFRLDGKRALVTGAGRGIGLSAAGAPGGLHRGTRRTE